MITLGSVASLLVVSKIVDMPCMGAKTCYTYAFLIPTIVFILAVVVFVASYRWYHIVPPMRKFVPWKAIKAVYLAHSRYSNAIPEERVAKGHSLNFAED
ncbi:hypothetical protein BGZ73_008961, partial [Actinomortierella ambigua]